MNQCKVTFQPGNRVVTVPEGTDLLTAAIAADVQLYNGCGGEGICGECRIIVREGQIIPSPNGRLTEADHRAGYHLACRTKVKADVQIEVPPESRTAQEQILTRETGAFSRVEEVKKGVELETRVPFTASPLSSKRFLRLPAPTLDDNISDLDRLYREIRRQEKIPHLHIDIDHVKGLGRLLRNSDWAVTVTLAQGDGVVEVVSIEPGDTSRQNYGVVLDIGTTTLVAGLVDLNSGQGLGTRATRNPQRNYGEDVIARLVYAEKKGGLDVLHRVMVETVNKLIEALAAENNVEASGITAMVCAGNTTMTHLFLGVDPYYLRRDPYVPAAQSLANLRAADAGVKIHPHGVMVCMPGVASYVGGDITAGVIASGLDEADAPCMLIDIGTNGEIVLGNRDWLVCSSASAGPAFEGSGVQCGVRAMHGAIQRVVIDPESYEPTCTTIGNETPIGICGSGYIDLIAELFTTGLIDKQGVFRTDMSHPRMRQGEGGPEYVLTWAEETKTGRFAFQAPERFLSYSFRYATDIVITQMDIENLIRSKGSIYSAAKVMADKVGIALQDIEMLYIGGGFGNYLDVENAVRIGLLPDLPRDRFAFIGNSSLTGARIALRSGEGLAKAREIAERMMNIELCAESAYMEAYVGSLFLPHTDIDLFPTVKQQMGV